MTSLPWWAKLASKAVLSKLPGTYDTWRSWPVFRHGRMEDPDYSTAVFDAHVRRTLSDVAGRTVLELGPGDSIASAVCAAAAGAERTFLVDTGSYASEALETYLALAEQLRSAGLEPPDLRGTRSVDDVLSECRAEYLTGGLEDLRGIAPASVDLIFSQAVLEHVRLADFDATMRALRGLLNPDGMASHRVDLKDHLDRSLHNLRFRRHTWERPLIHNSGCYTNRIRYTDMCDRFEHAGFDVDIVGVERWDSLPVVRRRLAKPFAALPDDELRVSAFDVVLRPRAN